MYENGYGTVWHEMAVYRREGYQTSVTDYHEHAYFEINLILSGHVKILLSDRSFTGTGPRVVLTRPHTPHYISCEPDTLYRRLYLSFSAEFLSGFLPETEHLLAGAFGRGGETHALSEAEADKLRALIEAAEAETDPLRRRLWVCLLLSLASEHGESTDAKAAPAYLMETMRYVEAHYAEKLCAADIARTLFVGRTTLLTGFAAYTGLTLGAFVTACRVRHAEEHLAAGRTVEETARLCGFADAGGLSRAFRRVHGVSPRAFMKRAGS